MLSNKGSNDGEVFSQKIPSQAPAGKASSCKEEKKMTREDFNEKVDDLSIDIGMNQRYHQREAWQWWLCDTVAKIGTAIFAVAGLAMAIVIAFAPASEAAHIWEILVALCAAIGAIILNVVPFGEWANTSKEFLRQWTELKKKIVHLELDRVSSDPPSQPSIDDLLKQQARAEEINGSESPARQKLLEECLAAEERSHGIGETAAA